MHDDHLDPEGPSAEDIERFGDAHLECPNCRREVYDEIALCPHCGHAMEATHKPMPAWTVIAALAVVGLILWYWVF